MKHARAIRVEVIKSEGRWVGSVSDVTDPQCHVCLFACSHLDNRDLVADACQDFAAKVHDEAHAPARP